MSDPRLKNKDWRISHFYKIRNKRLELVTFKRNAAQEHFNKNRHSRNIILKSRQLGFTTDESIDMTDDMLFTRNFEGLFIAQDLDTAKDIFDNKIKLAWDNYRLKNLYGVDLNSARKLKVSFGDGTFSAVTVDSSGRSGTFNRLHVSEFGTLCKMFPDRAQEVISGSIPAVPTDGRVDIESTAEEASGLFYDMFWEAWNRGEPTLSTQFKAHFYSWRWDEEIKTTDIIQDIPKAFRDYQKKYNLNDREISYYYMKYSALGDTERSWSTMKRQYPTTPEEAFEGAGDKLFDLEKLGLMQSRTAIKEEHKGLLRIYKEYKLGHTYAMGCDVAEGVGKDSSTMALWDFTPAKPEIVADYANDQINPSLFAFEIKNLAEKYELPLVAVERNNHGHTTIAKLQEIYPERHIYAYAPDKYGWLTNLITKPKMMYDLSNAINDELVEVVSGRILAEMRRYDKGDLRIIRGTEDTTDHWDLLIAATIGFQMKDFAAAVRRKKTSTGSGSTVRRGKGIRGT